MTPAQRRELRRLAGLAKSAVRAMEPDARPAPVERLIEYLDAVIVPVPCEYCGGRMRNRGHIGAGIDASPLCARCRRNGIEPGD